MVWDTGVRVAVLVVADASGDSGMSNGNGNGWCIDKRIPVAVVALVLAQSLAIGIWAGSISTRVEASETAIETITLGRHEARVSVLESQIDAIRATLDRIADRLGVAASNQPLPRPQPRGQ